MFEYYQDNKLMATDYFLKQAGEENPDSGSNVFGGSIGGPIVKNTAFFFFNYEGTKAREAANLNFPPQAAPLAVSYSTTTAAGWLDAPAARALLVCLDWRRPFIDGYFFLARLTTRPFSPPVIPSWTPAPIRLRRIQTYNTQR